MSISKESIWAGLPTTVRGVAVHLSYDAKSDRIVYASNRSVIIRSVAEPEKSVQYVNHTVPVTVAKFAPSGFYIASGDESGNVKVWDCVGEDMVTKGDYPVISGRINDLSWDADSQRIIAVGHGKERYGHCFTADSGNSVGEISGHAEPINAVAIRPVRPYRAATVSDDKNLVFYQGPPFKFDFTSRGNHTNFVHDVKFSPDGQYLVSVGQDRKIVVYDGKTGELKSAIESGHEGGIFSLAWSSDSKTFATASADGSVKLFDIDSLKAIKKWSLDKTVPNQQVGVVFAGDKRLISLAFSGDLYYWNTEDESKPERVINGHQKSINGITNDNGVLYTAGSDSRVAKWTNGIAEYVQGNGHDGPVIGIGASGSKLFSTAWDDTVKEISSGKFAQSHAIAGQPIAIDVVAEGALIVTESSISLLKNGSPTTQGVKFTASGAAISSKLVAVGNANTNTIHLYNSSDLSEVGTLPPLRAAASELKFSPNGKHLAVGDRTGKITLYDVEEKKVVTSRWSFHTSKVTSIDWHSSGDYVVTGSLDTNIYIYSVAKPGVNVKFLGAHIDGVNGVVWTSDKTFASVGADATVKSWTVTFK